MESTLKYVLKVDASSGKAELRGFSDELGKTGDKTEELGRKGKTAADSTSGAFNMLSRSIGGIAAVIAASKIFQWFRDITVAAVTMGMEAVESENLFTVSMGEMASAARKWSEDLSAALGLNEFELRKNVATFNQMFISMGMGTQSAYDMATGLTQLAYDMASFYNLKPEEAFQKLQAGITGEIEPLKRLGIIVNETTTKTWAYTNGIVKQGEELTEQQKVLARYGVIMQQTANAQGDLARTIDSPANALRVFRSQIDELMTKLGQTLLPVMQVVLSIFNDLLRQLDMNGDSLKTLAQAVAWPINAFLGFQATVEDAGRTALEAARWFLEAYKSLREFSGLSTSAVDAALGSLNNRIKTAADNAKYYRDKQALLNKALDEFQAPTAAAIMAAKLKAEVDQKAAEQAAKFRKEVEKVKAKMDEATAGNKAFVQALTELQTAGRSARDIAFAFNKQLLDMAEAQKNGTASTNQRIQALIEEAKRQDIETEAIKAAQKAQEDLTKAHQDYLYVAGNLTRLTESQARALGESVKARLEATGKTRDGIEAEKLAADWLKKYNAILEKNQDKLKLVAAGQDGANKQWNEAAKALSVLGVKTSSLWEMEEALRALASAQAAGIYTQEEVLRGYVTLIDQELKETGRLTDQSLEGLTAFVSDSDYQLRTRAREVWEGYVKHILETTGKLPPHVKAVNDQIVKEQNAAKWPQVWANQISTIVTDLSKGISESIIKWKGFWSTLKSISSEFGTSILRTVIEPFFGGILKGIGGLMSGKGTAGFDFGALGGMLAGLSSIGATKKAIEAPLAAVDLGGEMLSTTKNGVGFFGSIQKGIGSVIKAIPGWGWAVAGIAAGVAVLWKVFKKNPAEEFMKDLARDFGGISLGKQTIEDFAKTLGLTMEQVDGIRKDLASSPLFLKIAYEAAEAQGKTEEFLTSLERIETAWGTFNFRDAFEKGLETGMWDDLNDAFVKAFGVSERLRAALPDLTKLFLQNGTAVGEAAQKSQELFESWADLDKRLDELRGKPEKLTADLAFLTTAAASNAEIIELLGSDIKWMMEAVEKGLIATLPDAVQAFLDLLTASERAALGLEDATESIDEAAQAAEKYAEALANLRGQPQAVAEALTGFQAAGATSSEILQLIGSDIKNVVALFENGLIPAIPDVIQAFLNMLSPEQQVALGFKEIAEAVQQASDSFLGGWGRAAKLLSASADLGDELQGYGSKLLKTLDSEQARNIAWDQLGNQIIEHIELYKLLGLEVDWRIQQAYDWAAANGKLTESAEKVAKAVEEWASKFVADWEKMRASGGELEQEIFALGTALLSQMDVSAAQNTLWEFMGSQILELAANYKRLGLEIPELVQMTIDWAEANGKLTESAEETARAVREIALPKSVQDWRDLQAAGKGLATQIYALGVELLKTRDITEAQHLGWKLMGQEIVTLANQYKGLGLEIPELVRQTIEWAIANGYITESAEGLYEALKVINEAVADSVTRWQALTQSSALLGDELEALGHYLLKEHSILESQQIGWKMYGDEIIRTANEAKLYGLTLDPIVQASIEWAIANGYITESAEGLYEIIKKIDEVVPKSVQDWRSFKAAGKGLEDQLVALGHELLKEYEITEAQRIGWLLMGDSIVQLAEEYEKYGLKLPPVLQMALDLARANGWLTESNEAAAASVTKVASAYDKLRESESRYHQESAARAQTAQQQTLRAQASEILSSYDPAAAGSEADRQKTALARLMMTTGVDMTAAQGIYGKAVGSYGADIVWNAIRVMMGLGLTNISDALKAMGIIDLSPGGDPERSRRKATSFDTGGSVLESGWAWVDKGEEYRPAKKGRGSFGDNVTIIIEGPVYGMDDLEEKVAEAWTRRARRGGFAGMADRIQ